MPSQSNISPSGTIQNLLNLGFTQTNALCELIDNSLDAGAKQIKLVLNTERRTLTLVDNGCGMNKNDLNKALRINGIKPASELIGLRGVGLNAGHAVLSNNENPSHIISHKLGSEVYEVELDWSDSIATDTWNPTPHLISARNAPLWNTEKLEGPQGTLTLVQMTESTLGSLLKTDHSTLLKDLGRTYENYLANGVSISIVLDDQQYAPDTSLALNWQSADKQLRKETLIRCLKNPETGEKRFYWLKKYEKPKGESWVREDPKNKKAIIREDYPTESSGFKLEGEFKLQSVYKREWNPLENGEGGLRLPLTEGFIVPCRENRFLTPFKIQFPSNGDFEKRRYYASSRHSIQFTHTCDAFFGVQVNKSNITRENVDNDLLHITEKLANQFASDLYDKSKPKKVKGEEAHLSSEEKLKKFMNRVKEDYFKYGGDQFEEEYTQWIDVFFGEEDIDY
jgi:hypothetical protein